MTDTDIAILGAGPIGLELAVNLKALGADYLHLDAGTVGQTMTWYPRQVRFFSSPERIAIAGVPLVTADQSKATREEYLAYLHGIVQQFDLPVRTGQRVERIEPVEGGFVLHSRTLLGEERIRARRVVCAVGDLHGPRRLDIPGEGLPHVSHYFTEPYPYFRKKLLIVGGRNSAVEAALRCHRAGAYVTLSYRRQTFDAKAVKYWILPELQWLIRKGDITFLPGTQPVRIEPGHVELASVDTPANVQRVEADHVLLLVGYVMDGSLLEGAGVELVGENRGPRFDRRTMQTNVPGLFVAGTAAAGTQHHFRLFIENCHPHVVKICRTLLGQDPPHVNPLGFERLHEDPFVHEDRASES